MLPKNPAIAGGPAAGVAPTTPGESGVAQTTPAQTTVDDAEKWKSQYAELQSQLEEFRQQAERDVRQLKSSLQSQIAEQQRLREQERLQWEEERFRLATQGLDENERTKAELQLLAQRLAERDQYMAQLQAELENARRIPEYLATFGSLGLDVSKLPVHDPVELVNQGWTQLVTQWQEMAQRIKELEARASAVAAPAAPAAAAAPGPAGSAPVVAPAVATATAGGAAGSRTWPQVIQSVSEMMGYPVTQDQVYDLVAQGRLPHTIIPGLENVP